MTASLDIRVVRPDAVIALPESERRETLLGNDFLLHEEHVGRFVRCLVPVRLTGDTTITFGAWLRVDDAVFERVEAAWKGPDYASLRFDGTVANAVQPWGTALLGAPVTAAVLDEGALPYVVATPATPFVSRLVTDEWDRDEVLSSLWQALPVTFAHRVTDSWSVTRTAGMHAVLAEGTMRFVGPGRTVIVDAFGLPAGADPEDVVATLFAGAPEDAEHHTDDRDGQTRRAYRVTRATDGVIRHDLYAFAAAGTGFLLVNCVYDDAGDAEWALRTFRSIRHHADA